MLVVRFAQCFVLFWFTTCQDVKEIDPVTKVSAFLGNVVLLPCKTNSTNGVDWWYKTLGGQASARQVYSINGMVNGFKNRFSVDTSTIKEYNLLISSVQFSDTGIYTCVHNAGFGARTSVKLNVYKTAEVKFAYVGEVIALPCKSSDTASVDWWYESWRTVDASQVVSLNMVMNGYVSRFTMDTTVPKENNLIIHGVQASDSGLYTCVRTAGFGKRTTVGLNVFDARCTTEVTATVGEIVVLHCNVTMISASGWWRRRSPFTTKQQVSLSREVNVRYKGRFTLNTRPQGDYNLVIHDARRNDSGMYSCIENSESSAEHRAYMQLEVYGTGLTGTINSETVPMVYFVGDVVLLPCKTNYTNGVDWWYISDSGRKQQVCSVTNIMNGFAKRMKLDISASGEFNLIIHSATVDDSGLYKCIYNAGYGKETSIKIRVLQVTRVSSSVMAFAGDTALLACKTGSTNGVDWWYRRSSDDIQHQVVSIMSVLNGFRARFSLDVTDTADYNLIVHGAQHNDTGLYTCYHNGGYGPTTSVKLTVFNTNSDDQRLTLFGEVSESLVLPCSVRVQSAASWWFQNPTTSEKQQVSLSKNVTTSFEQRFSLNLAQSTEYNLVIHDIQVNDTGLYTCFEDIGLRNGRTSYVYLNVLDIKEVANHQQPASERRVHRFGTVATTSTVISALCVIITGVVTALAIFVCCVCKKGYHTVPPQAP